MFHHTYLPHQSLVCETKKIRLKKVDCFQTSCVTQEPEDLNTK